MLNIPSMTRLLSDRYWINEVYGVHDFFANEIKVSKSQLHFSQTAERGNGAISDWHPWGTEQTDYTILPSNPLVSTQQAQCGQLTCPHYHPGQRWDGAELPAASSHLQLRRNRRERCSGAWQAAWPSPGTEHLQHKVSSSSARLFSLEHHLLLTGICAATEIQSVDHQALFTASLRWLLITSER